MLHQIEKQVKAQVETLKKELSITDGLSKEIISKCFYDFKSWSQLKTSLSSKTEPWRFRLLSITLASTPDELQYFERKIRAIAIKALKISYISQSKQHLYTTIRKCFNINKPSRYALYPHNLIDLSSKLRWSAIGPKPERESCLSSFLVINDTYMRIIAFRVYDPSILGWVNSDNESPVFGEANYSPIWTKQDLWKERTLLWLQDEELDFFDNTFSQHSSVSNEQAKWEKLFLSLSSSSMSTFEEQAHSVVINNSAYLIFGYPCLKPKNEVATKISLRSEAITSPSWGVNYYDNDSNLIYHPVLIGDSFCELYAYKRCSQSALALNKCPQYIEDHFNQIDEFKSLFSDTDSSQVFSKDWTYHLVPSNYSRAILDKDKICFPIIDSNECTYHFVSNDKKGSLALLDTIASTKDVFRHRANELVIPVSIKHQVKKDHPLLSFPMPQINIYSKHSKRMINPVSYTSSQIDLETTLFIKVSPILYAILRSEKMLKEVKKHLRLGKMLKMDNETNTIIQSYKGLELRTIPKDMKERLEEASNSAWEGVTPHDILQAFNAPLETERTFFNELV